METFPTKTYPDISRILNAKKNRRKALVQLSWEEKVSIVARMRQLLPRGKWEDGASVAINSKGQV